MSQRLRRSFALSQCNICRTRHIMADIASLAGQQMIEQGMHQVAQPGGGGPVNVEDQLRFEQAMQGESVEKVPEEAVAQAGQAAASGQTETMGDTILKGLQD